MRAAVLIDAEEVLEVQEVGDPAPGPHDLVLAVDACGICGSDLHLAVALRQFPGIVFGHEFCGRVVAIGAEVSGWNEGDRAVGFPLTGCGSCPACVGGHTAKCDSTTMAGLQRPGGYAEFVSVGAREAFALPEPLTEQHGALVEPLAVALHGLDRTPREQGDAVLVLGGGPVGLATATWALHLGSRHVVVSDPLPARRRLAEKLGASTVDPVADDVGAAFADLTGSRPTAIIECVGVPGLIQSAVDVAAPDAHLTVVGACLTPDTIVPTTALAKELTLRFVLYYRDRDFATTIDALAGGRFDPLAMITGEVGIDDLPARFRSLMANTEASTTDGKVLVTPSRKGAA